MGKLLSYIITKNFKPSILLKLEDIFSRLLEAFKIIKIRNCIYFHAGYFQLLTTCLLFFVFYIVTIILEINMLDIFEVIYVDLLV